MIGQLLDGRYKIIDTLGAGGFGQTYIAENTRLPGNPKCVIKQLKPASNDPNTFAIAKRLFNSEAETLVKLGNHNQIPRITDFFDESQEFYLVQDYIEGHTLAEELTPAKKLSEAYVIALLKDVLPILEFIHQQNVIHRDIKPANIIRRKQDGKLFLIDFGAVKEVQALATAVENQQSAHTVAIGTPGYMPTEQGRGKPRPSSDLFALGMIAIEALTGLYPDNLEEDSQTGEILWQHQATVSTGLAKVLTKMTRYHFKDRYQSADEVLQALQQLENPAPIPTVLPNPSNYKKTEAVTQTDVQVHELTLTWVETGQTKTQIISDQQSSKNRGTVRIGRDSSQCDIVLSEPTVSGLHVEIFFNQQQQRFYVRNLRSSNPPIVNGQQLQTGEVEINQGSSLKLGQAELRVSGIAVKQYPPGYQATQYRTEPLNVPSHPVLPTVQPTKGEDIEVTLEILPNETVTGTSREITFARTVYVNGSPSQETKKLIVDVPAYSQDGARLQFIAQGNEGLYGGSAGDVYVRLLVKREAPSPVPPPIPDNILPVPPEPSKRKFPAWLARGLTTSAVLLVGAFIRANWHGGSTIPPSFKESVSEQCRLIAPTESTAKIRDDAKREANVITELGRGTQVLAIGESGAFVQIRTPDSTTGWVFNDQVQNCPS